MDKSEVVKLFGGIMTAYDCWRWVSVDESLPQRCKEVLVWGLIDGINICSQIHIGRRWSGWSSGWDGQSEGKEPPWEWLNPQDIRIAKVTHWMYFPDIPRGEHKIGSNPVRDGKEKKVFDPNIDTKGWVGPVGTIAEPCCPKCHFPTNPPPGHPEVVQCPNCYIGKISRYYYEPPVINKISPKVTKEDVRKVLDEPLTSPCFEQPLVKTDALIAAEQKKVAGKNVVLSGTGTLEKTKIQIRSCPKHTHYMFSDCPHCRHDIGKVFGLIHWQEEKPLPSIINNMTDVEKAKIKAEIGVLIMGINSVAKGNGPGINIYIPRELKKIQELLEKL